MNAWTIPDEDPLWCDAWCGRATYEPDDWTQDSTGTFCPECKEAT